MKPYYQDESVTLYHGDARELLPQISETVGVVILDPPYFRQPSSVRGIDDGAAGYTADPVRMWHGAFKEAMRLLRAGGVSFVFCDYRAIPDVTYLMALSGMRWTSTVAWVRSVPGTGSIFRSAWDPILVGSNGTPDVVDKSAVMNVYNMDRPARQDHPYEKPETLIAYLAKRVEGVVIDPFCGSGTSLAAAKRLGRKSIGIEINEKHCETISRRLSQGALTAMFDTDPLRAEVITQLID